MLKCTEVDRLVQCFGLPMSGSWSIRAYGDHGALVLAKAWIYRHHLFLRAWLEAGGHEGFAFEPELVRSYQEPPELTALSIGAEGALLERIAQFRGMQPR